MSKDDIKTALELAAGALEQRCAAFLFNDRQSKYGKELEAAAEEVRALYTPRPFAEYHEDIGAVLWWRFPIQEPPYCGWPEDDAGFIPGWHTHWTPIPKPTAPALLPNSQESVK
jgi:hypothetical protein